MEDTTSMASNLMATMDHLKECNITNNKCHRRDIMSITERDQVQVKVAAQHSLVLSLVAAVSTYCSKESN